MEEVEIFVKEVLRNLKDSGTLDKIPEVEGQDLRALVKLTREKAKAGVRGHVRNMVPGFANLKEEHFKAMGLDTAKAKSDAIDEFVEHKNAFIENHLKDCDRIANEFGLQLTEENRIQILTVAWVPVQINERLMNSYGRFIPIIEENKRYINWARRHYNNLQETLFRDPYFSPKVLSRIAVEIGVVLGVLDAFGSEPGYDPEQALKWAQRQQGFTQPGGGLRRQAFWGKKIVRLVDMVDPLCKWRKGEWHKAGKSSPQVRDRALKFVARLLHTCYPDVWLEDYKIIGRRYRNAKGRQQT